MKHIITFTFLVCLMSPAVASSPQSFEEQTNKHQLALLTQENPDIEEAEATNEISETDVPSMKSAEKHEKKTDDESTDYAMYFLLGGGILILLGILLAIRKRKR